MRFTHGQMLANDYGINFAPGFVPVEYIDDAILASAQLAEDAQPPLITQANNGIPGFLTNLIDPELIRVVTAPLLSEEIYGSVKKGDWTTLTAQFPTAEMTGQVKSYGDFDNGGNAGANFNWVPRQSYHFQTVTQWGEREAAQFGVARINYAGEQNMASIYVINTFANNVNFYGISGLQLYGALNDPNLIAPILPTVKAAGGYTWPVATAQEIYNDVKKLFGQLNTQMGGNVQMDARMTLALSTLRMPDLHTVSTFNVTALTTIKQNFPNLRIVAAPQYSLQAGELMQLILDDYQGIKPTMTAFTEKLRTHPVIVELSSYKQKKSAGTWGFIGRRPIAIAQMQGI